MRTKKIRECEDCEEEMESGHRRVRCKSCKRLICGWCEHHTHRLPHNAKESK